MKEPRNVCTSSEEREREREIGVLVPPEIGLMSLHRISALVHIFSIRYRFNLLPLVSPYFARVHDLSSRRRRPCPGILRSPPSRAWLRKLSHRRDAHISM